MGVVSSSRMIAALLVLAAAGASCNADDTLSSAPVSTGSLATTPTTAASTATTASAASSVPTTTIVPTTTASTDPVPSTAPATSAPATSAPTATTPVTTIPAGPTDDVAVAYVGGNDFPAYIVAVWTGTEWASPSWSDDGTPSDVPTAGSLSTTALGLTAPVSGATAGELDYYCFGDDRTPLLTLPVDPTLTESNPLSVTASWNIQPRPGISSPDPAVFAEAGYTMVDTDETAFAADGVVTQAVDVDLDGDGVDEAVYTYEHHTPDASGFGTEGDYSVVVAMYADPDGVIRHHVLFELYEHPDVQPGEIETEVHSVADLNGDGVMEVVIYVSYWESGVFDVYAFDDAGRLDVVSGGGCSA